MNTFWIVCENAGAALWLAGAIFFIIFLGVFSPKSLRAAPTRESTLSLPIVGAVIVLYFMALTAVLVVGVGIGVVPKSYLGRETPAASQPASSATAAAPAVTGPATIPAATTPAAAVPPPSDADKAVLENALDSVARLLTVMTVVLSLSWLFKERLAGWGLHPRQLPKGVLKGLAGFLIVYPLLMVFATGLDLFYRHILQHNMSEHPTFEALDQHVSLARQVLLCFSAIVVAPIAEEIFFRGILQTALIQYGWGVIIPQFMRPASLPAAYRPTPFQRWAAIVLTALPFALMHQLDQAPIIFLLALGLGYVYERTGTLWAPIALHMAFNTTNIATYLSGQG